MEPNAPNHPTLLPGMRREWHFTLHFLHASARVQLFCPPHWEPTFIEPERLKGLHTLNPDVKHCPLTPALRFLDYSVPPLSGVGAGGSHSDTLDTAAANPGHRHGSGGAEGMEDFGSGSGGVYGGGKRSVYDDGSRGGIGGLQNVKVVELLYSHISPSMTLSGFCCRSVQHVLKDPHVIAVDNNKRLRRLRVGKKLSSCPYRLGGERSFHFYYHVQQKTELLTHDVCYCVGTILGQRGYLLTVRGSDQESLDAYVLHLLMPYLCNPLHAKLNVAVEYSDDPRGHTSVVPSPALLSGGGGTSLSPLQSGGGVGLHSTSPLSLASPFRGVGVAGWGGRGAGSSGRGKGYTPLPSTHPATAAAGGGGGGAAYPLVHRPQEDYGEIRYEDQDAAISFSLALRPLRFRPDFSPTKTVGVGSIACMTLELNLFESLIDDEAVAEVAGMPKYKMNQVLLCLEVEDVARMNYPEVMTTSEYAERKTSRLLEGLSDAKVVGTSTLLLIGPRIGSNHIITFQYEPFHGLAKAMYVSTLVGNFGVTAYYLTKLGGGYFESHLHLLNELLRRLEYLPQHRDNITFSRFDVVNVRLLETELYRCYSGAPAHRRDAFQEHLISISESNDGHAEGAVVVPVAEEDGGYVEKGAGEVGLPGAGRASAVGGGGSPAPGAAGTPTSPAVSRDPKHASSGGGAAAAAAAEDEAEKEEAEMGAAEGRVALGPKASASSRVQGKENGRDDKKEEEDGIDFPLFSPTLPAVLGNTASSPPVEGKTDGGFEDWVDDREEVFSSHSRSLITVSSLTHLPMLLMDDEEEEMEEMEEREDENHHGLGIGGGGGGGGENIHEAMLAFLRQAAERKESEGGEGEAPLRCAEAGKAGEEAEEAEEGGGKVRDDGEASPLTGQKEKDASLQKESPMAGVRGTALTTPTRRDLETGGEAEEAGTPTHDGLEETLDTTHRKATTDEEEAEDEDGKKKEIHQGTAKAGEGGGVSPPPLETTGGEIDPAGVRGGDGVGDAKADASPPPIPGLPMNPTLHPPASLHPTTTSALPSFSALFPPPRSPSPTQLPFEPSSSPPLPSPCQRPSAPSLPSTPPLPGTDLEGAADWTDGTRGTGGEKAATAEAPKGEADTTTPTVMVGDVAVPLGWKPSPLPIPDRTVAPATTTTTPPPSPPPPPTSPGTTLQEGVNAVPGSVERTKQLLTGPAVSAVLSTISQRKSTPFTFPSPSNAAPSAPHPTHAFAASPSSISGGPVPTVKELYLHCCAEAQCKPNSYLLERLPVTEGREGSSMIEELDLSGNYVGHSGFAAVLRFLEYLPCLTQVYFNNMTLDNTDVENMCKVLATHPTIKGVHVRNNPSITLVSTKHLHGLLRLNKNIRSLSLQGTRLGDAVIAKLEAKAAQSR